MTLYVIPITVPAKTRPRSAQSQVLKVHLPVIDSGSVYFEDGCFDTVGVCFLDRGKQFAPHQPPGGWITGNAETIEWNEKYLIDGAPYEIEIKVYNMAADYPHNVEVRLEVVSETIEMAISRLVSALDRLTAKR